MSKKQKKTGNDWKGKRRENRKGEANHGGGIKREMDMKVSWPNQERSCLYILFLKDFQV